MRARKTTHKKKTARKKAVIPVMQIRKTKVFQSGNSRAVRLPKEFELSLGSVNIYMLGDQIIIQKKPLTIGEIWKSAPKLPAGTTLKRPKDDPPQERDFQWD